MFGLAVSQKIAGNVWLSAVAGIGGLGNGAKRNAKTDQLRPVPRHNVNKETESNEDTEPRHCRKLLLAPVALIVPSGPKNLPSIFGVWTS